MLALVAATVAMAGAPAEGPACPPGAPCPIPIPPPPGGATVPRLTGPSSVRVGQPATFTGRPGTLCYKHGSSRIRCQANGRGVWKLKILSGQSQYFTLRVDGVVLARLVYHDGGLQLVVPKPPPPAPPVPPEPPSSSGATTGSSGPYPP